MVWVRQPSRWEKGDLFEFGSCLARAGDVFEDPTCDASAKAVSKVCCVVVALVP